MNIEQTKVYNIKDAMRAMRNPKNSWHLNDTTTKCDPEDGNIIECNIGPNDTKLAQTLIKAGGEHRKFMRQIFVSADFTLPMYIVQEFDTYSVGKTRNSCSFQHKGASREFTLDDMTFDSFEDIANDSDFDNCIDREWFDKNVKPSILAYMNTLRRRYVDTGDYRYFRLLRQVVPMGMNIKFTWTANYEVLLNMYKQRKTHKLKEWHAICDWIKSLPGMDTFIIEDGR